MSQDSDKRQHSPDDQPLPKKLRSDDGWDDGQKVQLPSIFTALDDGYRGDSRRSSLPTLHSDSRVRHAPYPSASMRHGYVNGGYAFPEDERRPKVSTDVGLYESYPSTYSEESWQSGSTPSGIVRPSSTPGIKYDGIYPVRTQDRECCQIRHACPSLTISDFAAPYSPSLHTANIAVSSPSRSPPTTAMPPSQPLPDRPQRKRGKLPKETTDYLKAWLHRHSDHPYPSEEEKKQLCHATGLSMSQVSNWMINVCSLLSAAESADRPRRAVVSSPPPAVPLVAQRQPRHFHRPVAVPL